MGNEAFWSALESPVERYFHPDFELMGPQGTVTRARWVGQPKAFAESGMTVHVMRAEEGDSGAVLYQNRIVRGDGRAMEGLGLAEFREGQCVKMTPQDEAGFQKLLDSFTK